MAASTITESTDSEFFTGRPYCVALTGGIASGKTAASTIFSSLGVAIVDTDIIARQVVAPGQPGLQKIIQVFGTECMTGDGKLNRTALRNIIIQDKSARQQLEAILHPLIYKEALNQIRQANDVPYVIIVVPLLVETRMFDWVDRVLVIDVSETIQLERLQARDNMSLDAAKKMLAAQTTRQKRLSKADDVIRNESDLAALYMQCKTVHECYLNYIEE